MPLFFKETIGDGVEIIVWKLEETLEELLEKVDLETNNRQELDSISSVEKKREFLAGRYVLEKACGILEIGFSGMVKDEYGKPHLANGAYEISITHTENHIGVVFRKGLPVGIDLEKPRKQIFRILPRLYTESELELVGGDLDKATIFWSAKEALYKLYGKRGVDFKENLKLYENDGKLFGKTCFDGKCSEWKLYVTTIAKYFLIVAY